MCTQWILGVTIAIVACVNAMPQHTPAGTQPQQFSQAQLIAYLQQQQAQAQQQTQVSQQLAQQTPQTFQPAPQQQQQQVYQAAPQQQAYQPAPQPQLPRQQFLPQQIQQPQQPLLGVAYSSAADASKTSFNGYGISYNF